MCVCMCVCVCVCVCHNAVTSEQNVCNLPYPKMTILLTIMFHNPIIMSPDNSIVLAVL